MNTYMIVYSGLQIAKQLNSQEDTVTVGVTIMEVVDSDSIVID